MSQVKDEPMEHQQDSAQAKSSTSSSSDPVDIEKGILELCKQSSEGISDLNLQAGLPTHISSQQRLAALNRLLSLGKIDLVRSSQSGLLYRLKDLDALNATKDSDMDEKLIYSIIKDAGNKGIWIRDIARKTNLKTTVLNKALKSLESKKLIKSVSSVSASKKKVYMLFNLEPDRSLTGGAWYSGKDFESEFVEILNDQCYKYLCEKKMNVSKSMDPLSRKNASTATTKEIREFIKNLGISKVDLSLEDIETILNTLVFDGKAERSLAMGQSSSTASGDKVYLYRAVNQLLPSYDEHGKCVDGNLSTTGICGTNFVRVPCGICPVIDNCHDDGPISPRTCVYMKEWLEF